MIILRFFFEIFPENYLRHPNTYLPTHGYNIPSENEGGLDENTPLHSPSALSDQDVEPYGFPSNRNRRKYQDDDIGSVITTLGKDLVFPFHNLCQKPWIKFLDLFQMSGTPCLQVIAIYQQI